MALPTSKSASLLAGGVILLAALAAYHGSFSGPFVLDDASSITDNPTLRHLWPLSSPLAPPRGEGQTVEGRPILNLSLALNYAISGTAVWSYHALNLAIHILAGLTLFGLARRTLENAARAGPGAFDGEGGPDPADEPARKSTFLAFAIALLWTVHPLQTEAVTYVVQRAESLMGLFYLLTLYCLVRSAQADGETKAWRLPLPDRSGTRQRFVRSTTRPAFAVKGWAILSFLACLCGMATKEVMVSAPLIALLYDRTLLSGSFRAAWRDRRGLYLGLVATWIPLALLVLRAGNRGGTSGPGSGIGVWTYGLTQFSAVIRYLRLAVWPHPLVFDYGTEWMRSLLSVWPSALAVILLAAGTVLAFFRPGSGTRAFGFLGCWFFAILAPTSLVPGNRQTMAEHRMYLALVPVIALGVMGLDAALRRGRSSRRMDPAGNPRSPAVRTEGAFATMILALAVGFVLLTARRNRDYRSLVGLYTDTVVKHAGNAFAQNNLGVALFSLGRVPEAIGHYQEAIRLRPDYATAHDNLGSALLHAGRLPEAVDQFEEALRLKPNLEAAHHNLGTALISLDRLPEAAEQFEIALRLDPGSAETHNNFGNLLLRLGRGPEAVAHYREALRLAPTYAEAYGNLGNVLSAEGNSSEAIACFQAALRFSPGDAETHYNFGNALLRASRPADAIEQFREALRLKPDYASAHDNLGNALLRLDRVSDAASQYEEALRLDPHHAVAHYNLGNALLRLGRPAEAVDQFREALRLQPDFSPARQMLLRLSPAP